MRFLLLTSFMVLVTACGDDGTGGSGGSGGAGAGGGSGAAGGSGGSDGSGGGASVTCGETLTCTTSEACVLTVIEPSCTIKENEADPCPEGTTESICGGAGFPCCCEPTPDPDRACVDATACGGSVSCMCLPDACTNGSECQDSGEGEVTCAPLPKP